MPDAGSAEAGAAAGTPPAPSAVHDDAGATPGFDELAAGFRAAELQDQVVEIGDKVDQRRDLGPNFAELRAAIHHASARRIEPLLEVVEGGLGGHRGVAGDEGPEFGATKLRESKLKAQGKLQGPIAKLQKSPKAQGSRLARRPASRPRPPVGIWFLVLF